MLLEKESYADCRQEAAIHFFNQRRWFAPIFVMEIENVSELVKIENSLTMSSLEIAELTGKQHKHVLADVRNMLNELKIDWAEFSAQYKDASGKANVMCNLPKRECLILVSGYSAVLRAKIVDRWLELEGKQPQASLIPDPASTIKMAFETICQVPGVKPGIAAAQFLTALQNATGVSVEPLRLALPLQEEPATLNPTKLGDLCGMTAREVNLELAMRGLQMKNARGEWELTPKGKRYAEAYPYTKNGHASYQILWKPEAQQLLS